MHQRTTKHIVPPSPPPWIHNPVARSSLAEFKIAIPPNHRLKGKSTSLSYIDIRKIYIDKALPPIPDYSMRSPTETDSGYRVPLELDMRSPFPPARNHPRYSHSSSFTTPGGSIKPLQLPAQPISSAMPTNSPISPTNNPLVGELSPSPLVVRHPVPLGRNNSKIARLTGCDLSLAEPIPSTTRPMSVSSISSDASSDYSQPSPVTSRDGNASVEQERKGSGHSLDSYVNDYVSWGSWSPTREDFELVLKPGSSDDAVAQSPIVKCQRCGCKTALSLSKTASDEDKSSIAVPTTPAPSPAELAEPDSPGPAPAIPPRSASRAAKRPKTAPGPKNSTNLEPVREGLSPAPFYRRKSPITLENLMELERASLRRSSEAPFSPHVNGPFSPLAKITALAASAQRDSGFGSDGAADGLPMPSMPIRSQQSMPVMHAEGMGGHTLGHARSISRFSISDDDDDAVSMRSMGSARLSSAVREVRNSFIQHVRGASATLQFKSNQTASRLSQVDGPTDEVETDTKHKHSNSTSSGRSVAWSLNARPTATKRISISSDEKTPLKSRFQVVTDTFKHPLRSNPNEPPPRPTRHTPLLERRVIMRGKRPSRNPSRRNSRNLTINAGRASPRPNLFATRALLSPPYTRFSSKDNSVMDLREALSGPSSTRAVKSPLAYEDVSSTRGIRSPTTFDDILSNSLTPPTPGTPSSTLGMKSPALSRSNGRRRSSVKVNSPALPENSGRQSPGKAAMASGRRFSITGKHGEVLGGFDTSPRSVGTPVLVTASNGPSSTRSSSPPRRPQRSHTDVLLPTSIKAEPKKGAQRRSFSVSVMAERVRGKMGLKSREERKREQAKEIEERRESLRNRIRVVVVEEERDEHVVRRNRKVVKSEEVGVAVTKGEEVDAKEGERMEMEVVNAREVDESLQPVQPERLAELAAKRVEEKKREKWV